MNKKDLSKACITDLKNTNSYYEYSPYTTSEQMRPLITILWEFGLDEVYSLDIGIDNLFGNRNVSLFLDKR